MSPKRIAICISGLARTYKKTIDNFKSKVLTGGHDYDIFLSTWSEIDSKTTTEFVIRHCKVDKGNISNSALNCYNPKTLEIEKQFKWDKKLVDKFNKNKRPDCYVPSTLFMFYKIWRADLLRRKIEKEFKFTYDIVVRTRFDMSMTKSIVYDLQNHDILMPKMTSSKCNIFGMKWINDTFAIGTSDSMRIYSDLHLHLEEIFNSHIPFQPEIMLNEWIERNKLSVGTPNSHPLIVRSDTKP